MVFTSIIDDFQTELWHFYLPVPPTFAEPFCTGNDRRVVCTLQNLAGKVEFQCALMPRGDGSYFINVNKKIRDKLKLKVGSQVEVSLKKDESEYGLPMPEAFAECLATDPEGNQWFDALTPGKKRNLLYIIGQVKNVDLQISRSLAILQHLKHHERKINFKQLNIDLRQR